MVEVFWSASQTTAFIIQFLSKKVDELKYFTNNLLSKVLMYRWIIGKTLSHLIFGPWVRAKPSAPEERSNPDAGKIFVY
jgi:hypothetical protein